MKDPELYDFFKKGSEAFDEMPSAGLWDKIDASLKEGKKAKPLKSLLIKALLFLASAALITWICFKSAEKTPPSETKIQTNPPVEENKKQTEDTLIRYDSLKALPNATPVLKTPAAITIKAVSLTDLTDEFDISLQTEEKPAAPVYKPEITNPQTEEIAETTTFKNRVVVRTTKKLTDAQYELLIENAIEKNKDNYGMMLIIIAPGHATYRKVIPGNKLDVKTTIKKTGILDTVSTRTKLISTDQVYFDAILKNQNLDVTPEFPGGTEAFYKYVSRNFVIPEDVQKNGKIIIQFVVETDGTLTDIKVLKDLGYGTGEAAIKALKSSPKWTPGLLNGKPVRVLYSLPIMISSGGTNNK